MSGHSLLAVAGLPDSIWTRLRSEFADVAVIDSRDPAILAAKIERATILYGMPPLALLPAAAALRWIQLGSAGVSLDFCAAMNDRSVQVTNLAGLYGPTIAEHALCLMTILARNLQVALRQQQHGVWQRDLAKTMIDLHGKSVFIVGLGNIGQAIARLCRAYGMRVTGCRRTPRLTPHVDEVTAPADMHRLLPEADFVVVAAPLTWETDGMLNQAAFAAMKRGAFYVNISRGRIAEEQALLTALQSGHIAGAGLDVFAVEPLPGDHPFWKMPSVIITPHYSGETVNNSAQPGELLLRNLRAFLDTRPLSSVVNLQRGY